MGAARPIAARLMRPSPLRWHSPPRYDREPPLPPSRPSHEQHRVTITPLWRGRYTRPPLFHLVSSRREVEGRGSFQGHPANIEGTPLDNRVNPLRRSMVFIFLSRNSIRHVSIECHVVRPIRSGDSSVVFLNNTLIVRVEHGVYAWKVRDETETALIGRRSKRIEDDEVEKKF